MNDATDRAARARSWLRHAPGRLMGPGHTAGDFLEAPAWDVLEQSAGVLRLRAHLPDRVKNPAGQLFGGFTPTYVDLVAVFTVRSGEPPSEAFRSWLATTSMRVDYFAPVVGPRFLIDSRLVTRHGRTALVETRFFDPDDTLAVFAVTTLRDVPIDRVLGDG